MSDVCVADSGGPAVNDEEDLCLYGIVTEVTPSMYNGALGAILTRVSFFEQWIKDTMRDLNQ